MSAPAAADPLEAIDREHPEFRPWARLLEAVRAETARPRCAVTVPEPRPAVNGAPLLDGATLTVSPRAADRWVRGLLATAAAAGASASLAAASRDRSLDGLAVLEAAIAADPARLDALAGACGADPAAFAPIAAAAAMPLLQACGRRYAPHVPADWDRGYCPICGAWPALAEARGLERERRLRCARCGADWLTEWLRCVFCGNGDHLRLGALAPETTVETRKADTCEVCRRYVKTITTLGPTEPSDVPVQDLATVDLDAAALAHGYEPARGLGYPVKTRVAAGARRLPWTR